MLRKLFFSVLLIGFIFYGCTSDEDNGITPAPTGLHTLKLSFQGLEMLQNGFHYEGWAIINGQPVTTGKFNVDASGNLVDLNGNSIANSEFDVTEDLSSATAIVITIEPNNDSNPDPAETHILSGNISNTGAMLTVSDQAALGSDFSSATGEYILATPTNGSSTNENSGIWFLNPPSTTFAINFSNLEPLNNGYHYEGWVIDNGSPVSTGKFNVDSSGDLEDLNGNPIANGEFSVVGDLSSATDFVLTIEPANDTDPAPAETHYLAGSINGGSANLTIGHGAALGDDFSSASGNYILATPTDGSNTNENSGIWFLDLTSGMPSQGIQLPTLPSGWKYEGWVVINGMPVTSGTFLDAVMADDSAPFSSTQPGPPFPGEDYLMNAPTGLTFPTDLAGQTAVISIEPYPDDAAAPFTLKPLVGMIPSDAVDHVTYSMTNNTSSLPSGTVTVTTNGPMQGLQLATLPAGWKYEGWVVINGIPVTTGTFTNLAAVDDSGPYSGSQSGPPFPGEDFLQSAPSGLTFPTDIAGGIAVISIEPSPDDAPTPFTLKPLAGDIPIGAMDHFVYSMNNNSTSFPTGSVTLQ